MDRFAIRCGVLVVAAVVAAGGCRSALFTVSYLLKGSDVEAEYDGLQDKKVVVVCRPVVELAYSDSSVARDLAKQVGILLKANDDDIEVVRQQDVDEWADENMWDEFTEVGKALEADMVVGIDLQDFTIFKGQTLYQGKANVAVRVYDCSQPGEPVFEKVLPQVVYPPNTGVPTHEKPEREFRQRFVEILADQIGRHFYAHDRYADYAKDATALD